MNLLNRKRQKIMRRKEFGRIGSVRQSYKTILALQKTKLVLKSLAVRYLNLDRNKGTKIQGASKNVDKVGLFLST